MADNKASSKSKKSKDRGKVKRVERTERRFVPERSNTAMLTMGGSIVGGLAGPLMHGGGFGRPGNVAVGILGAFGGGFLFSLAPLSVEEGLIGCPLAALVGAVVLLLLGGLSKKP